MSLPREWYSAREIAAAAGVPQQRAIDALGGSDVFVAHETAVAVGRELASASYFSLVDTAPRRLHSGLPLIVSGTLHAGLVGTMLVLLALGRAPVTATAAVAPSQVNTRLVYLNLPGPGGGGGGGGRREPKPPAVAKAAGASRVSSPIPRRDPAPVEPVPIEPPPLETQTLPPVMAPVVPRPADPITLPGVVDTAEEKTASAGPGAAENAGAGRGTGIGNGQGPGIGQGSGGGTGGGPYRPGSGITPPRLLKEVKAEYTDAARRLGISGDVVLEIVVVRDGSVGEVRLLKGLRSDLDERAVQAVRQWRFAPATRLGTPVDVLVEIAVEFKIR